MSQPERSKQSLRQETTRRRKASRTQQPRWRRLVLELLEDRRLLAAEITGISPGIYWENTSGPDAALTNHALPTISGTVGIGYTVGIDLDAGSCCPLTGR